MDVFLIIIFLVDFLRRMHLASDDRAYLLQGKGWLDLISIVPMLRIARILRILRVTRLLGRMGGPLPAVRLFFKDRASGGLLLVLLLAIVVLEFGSIAVLWAERASPNANITTADDALWYSIVTMSTVGYGDQYPVTDLGRLIGTGIIILGVGVFGTLTGFLANAFLAPAKSDDEGRRDGAPGFAGRCRRPTRSRGGRARGGAHREPRSGARIGRLTPGRDARGRRLGAAGRPARRARDRRPSAPPSSALSREEP